jgi:hypothetical protein
MKYVVIGVVTFAMVALSIPVVLDQQHNPGNAVLDREATRNGWISNLEEGRAQSRKSAKPLMVVLRCNP